MVPVYSLPNGRVATFHDNACHGEDAFVSVAMDRCIALDAVLDGATGSGGQYASHAASEALQNSSVGSPEALLSLLETINQSLYQRGKGRFFLTTLSVALKVHDTLHVVSIGDSPVFLLRGNALMPLTTSAKRATSSGMTALLGRHDKLSYEATQVALRENDRLLLATDGVSDNVAAAELADLMRQADTPDAAVNALRQLLSDKQRGHRRTMDTLKLWLTDDATAVIRYLERRVDAATHPATEK
jgi:serine/threonine protein phosphatase PrpC